MGVSSGRGRQKGEGALCVFLPCDDMLCHIKMDADAVEPSLGAAQLPP